MYEYLANPVIEISEYSTPAYLWNSLYLARKVSLSERTMLVPRWSSRSAEEAKPPEVVYSCRRRSARKVVKVTSCDRSAQLIAAPILRLPKSFYCIGLHLFVTSVKCNGQFFDIVTLSDEELRDSQRECQIVTILPFPILYS